MKGSVQLGLVLRAVLVTLALGCGNNSSPRPPDIGRLDGGDASGGDGASGDGGVVPDMRLPEPEGSQECALRQCNMGVSDLCCPSACSAASDIDCAGCGNGRIEAGEMCDPADSCPQSCPQLKCEKQRIKSEGTCAAVCVSAGTQTSCMSGDECCPAGCTALNDRDCTSQCGNGTTEPGELCDTTCPQGCPMRGCTILTLQGAGTCLARCVEGGQETQCKSDDGCCPAGCTAAADNDCGIVCGNGTVEGKETCDPLASCPQACPSPPGDSCRMRKLVNAGTCTAACVDMGIETQCKSGDGCCPVGCLSNNDADCPALCGNSVVEAGETCDPIGSCLDKERACVSDGSTTRTRSGDSGKCQFTCTETARVCGPSDGACPPGCGPTQDRDCAGCGNGVTEPSETCDPVATCLERQKSCVSDQSTIRTPSGDPNACTFSCTEAPRACGPADSSCPSGCTAARDLDCAGCGNAVLDPGETCDPVADCNNRAAACRSDANVVRTPEGDPANCRFVCKETPRMCGAIDGQCPASCTATQDRDCAGCGNGVMDPGETCDPCRPEDVKACAGDANTVRTPSGNPAACTFSCINTPRPCANSDGFCPAMCTAANDNDCGLPPGGDCSQGIKCSAGSCVDGRCCVQTCGVCQQCTGAGGSCVAIPAGSGDNVPAGACARPNSCDGAGACQPPNCPLMLKPGKHDFGRVPVGGTSAPATFTVNFACAGAVNATSSSPNEFVIVSNSCAAGASAAAGCTVTVQFRPGAAGARTAALLVTVPGGAMASSSLQGIGVAAQLQFEPERVEFDKVPVGERATRGVKLINKGLGDSGPLTVNADEPFSVAQNGCPSLAPGAACEMVLLFAPRNEGGHKGKVMVKGGGDGANVHTTGTGVGQPVQPLTIAPSSHAFGPLFVGADSAPVPFRVTAGITLTDLKVSSSSGEFLVTSNGCEQLKVLEAGMSCQVAVVFAPRVAGRKQAVLQATARDAGIFIAAPPLRTATSALAGNGTLKIITPDLPPPIFTQ